MLTAGHCTELNAGARAYSDEHAATSSGYPFTGGVAGLANAYPGWHGGLFLPDTGDAGVVVLSQPAPASITQFATFAPVGYPDDLATARGQKNVNFKVVGYGLQSVKPVESALKDRLKTFVQLVNLRSNLTDGFNIQTTNAPAKEPAAARASAIQAGRSSPTTPTSSWPSTRSC